MLARCIPPLALLFAAAPFAAADERPNLLVILADDLGYGDVQCYNPQRGKIATPNLDRLAAEGLRFTDAHSSSGVCSPSRYTLLTGRYHWRTRLQRGIVGLWERPLIAPDRLTLAGLVRRRGYRTACVGKWHLGWDWPIAREDMKFFRLKKNAPPPSDVQRAAWRRAFSQPIAGGPTTRGFDEYFGTDVPNWPPYCFIENDRAVGIPSELLPAALLRNHQASRQGPALPDWKLEAILPTLGERAAEFIARQAKAERPFLLYLPLTAPHTPLAVADQWKGKSGLNAYADFVMETDAVVGRVLAALEQSGAADNTLVVFTSDNGCAPYIGAAELERAGHYPSGPLRGYKADAWEGGHRVPFIIRWPGVVEPGRVCDQLVHQADLMATFADILNVKLPENAGEDSFSLLPLLKPEGSAGASPSQDKGRYARENAVSASLHGMLAIRQGPWKLIFGRGSGGWSKGKDAQPAQLYHLGRDLGETQNLYAEHPEVVARLDDLMGRLISAGRGTPGTPQKNDVPVRWKSLDDSRSGSRQTSGQP